MTRLIRPDVRDASPVPVAGKPKDRNASVYRMAIYAARHFRNGDGFLAEDVADFRESDSGDEINVVMSHQEPAEPGLSTGGNANLSARPPRQGHWRLAVAVVGLLLVIVLRLHSLGEPLEGDEATYSLMARIWSDGGQPYADLWDNKPIGLFWLYRAGLAVFGYNETMPRYLSMFPVVAVAGILIWWLRRAVLPRYVLMLVGLWPALSVWVPSYANGANAEVFLLPFIIGAFACLDQYLQHRREGLWWAAVCSLTISLLIKQVTLPFFLLPILAMPTADWRRWQRLAIRFGGMVLIVFAVHSLVYLVSGFGPFFFVEQFIANTGYGGEQGGLVRLWEWLTLAAKLPFHRSVLPLLALLVVALAGWLWRFKGWPRQRWFLWGGFAAASVGSVIIPGQLSEHYATLLLPALLAGAGLFQMRLPRTDLRWAFTVICILYMGILTWHFYLGRTPAEISEWKYGKWFLANRKLGRWLRERGVTNARIYVEGSHAPVYFYSGNLPASRFHCFYVTGVGGATIEEMAADIRQQEPDYLVYLNPQPSLPGLLDWRRENYEVMIKSPIKLFQRRSAKGQAASPDPTSQP